MFFYRQQPTNSEIELSRAVEAEPVMDCISYFSLPRIYHWLVSAALAGSCLKGHIPSEQEKK